MSMIKKGISSRRNIIEINSGNDMITCPHCSKIISSVTTSKNGNKCQYCGKSLDVQIVK